MQARLCDRRSGQVLVMVTLAMFTMFGMLGLVVDLGWSYFVRKSAQAAADAAAVAAVKRAQELTGGSSSASAYTCGAGGLVECTGGPTDCPGFAGNLTAACLYAQRNGFTTAGRQHVTVDAGDITRAVTSACGQGGATVHHPPTTGCVDTFYWVTVRVAEQTPQLFSAILGNSLGLVSARATAAVAQHGLPGALFLIGRGEPWNPSGAPADDGTNLWLSGGPTLTVEPGINLASDGSNRSGGYSGVIQGSGDIIADQTYSRGGINIQGSGTWVAPPTENVAADDERFKDPYDGMGQPPITTTVLTNHAVPGGDLDAYCGGNPCGPGNYFAFRTVGGQPQATGDPLVISSNVEFNGGSFGDFHFFGGLQIGGAQVTFGPGRYVIAGVKDPSRTPLFNNDNNAMLVSNNAGNGSDAGRIFILTDTRYPELYRQVQAIQNSGVSLAAWPGALDSHNLKTLDYSLSSIKAGNNANSSVSLYGLNAGLANLMPGETNIAGNTLSKFALFPIGGAGAGILFWQDQGNSYVNYDDWGRVEYGSCTINAPCTNASNFGEPWDPDRSPQFEIWASPEADLQGVVYQPRGAWSLVQASGDYTGALRIISGAMKFGGSGTLTMTGAGSPIIAYVTALIE